VRIMVDGEKKNGEPRGERSYNCGGECRGSRGDTTDPVLEEGG
jgi:hypothetical protein